MITTYNAAGLPITSTSTTGVMTMLNVKDYGAKGDGATNDLPAINTAIAAAIAGQGGRGIDLFFPSGIYAVNGPVAVVGNNVMLRGAGWQDTILYCTITTGDVLQFGNGGANSACGMMNMSVWKSAANGASGSNININGMNDCFIGNFVVNNGFIGITIQGSSIKVWIDQGEINNTTASTGTGIQVTNGLAGDTYIRGVVMSNGATAPLAGITVTQSGHIEIINCNVTKCATGLLVNPTGTQLANYGFVEHSLFDSCVTFAANFTPSGAATAKIQNWMFIDSWFSGSTGNPGTGINFTLASSAILDGMSFIGCRILNNFSNGVFFPTAGVQNISFTDCTISGNSAGSSGTLHGVNISANVNDISFVNCKIGQQGTAGNTQGFAISVAAGTSANLQFIANDCQPNVTVGNWGYLNIGALTGGGNQIAFNIPNVNMGMDTAYTGTGLTVSNTETVISSPMRLGANALRPASTIRFTVSGTCTTTVANISTFRIKMGTAGTTGDGLIMTFTTTAAGTTGTTIPFSAVFEITCRTVGATATFAGTGKLWTNAITGIVALQLSNVYAGTAATGSTITNNYINLTYQSAAATTTCIFQQVLSEIAID